jgi:hypothetical protein
MGDVNPDAAVPRLRAVDERFSAAALGGGLGMLLVAVVMVAVPASVPASSTPASIRSGGPGATSSPRAASSTTSLPRPAAVEETYALFGRRGSASAGGTAVELSTEAAGELVLQTGRVVATDVFFFGRELPFTRWLPAGTHPVSTLHARSASGSDAIAAAMIRVRGGDPVRWELALTAGQDATRLNDGEFFGYSVDSGTGAFASAEAVEWMADAGSVAFDVYSKRVEAAMFPTRNEFHAVANIPVGDPKGLNVIAFESGWGDGYYPSWFGVDAAGAPVVLLTDFQILDAAR